MKVCVTGSSGSLGGSLVNSLNPCYEFYLPQRLDYYVSDKISLSKNLLEYIRKSDLFFHCAAPTDLDKCELDRNYASKGIINLTSKIAEECQKYSTKLIYISSTGVYGDSKFRVPYKESDPVSPTSYHHQCKRSAELNVLQICPSSLVLRTGWLFGSQNTHAKDFVRARLREFKLKTGQTIFSDPFQMGNPTYIPDLISIIISLCNMQCDGIFNCVNPSPSTRYDFVQMIARISKANVNIEKSPQPYSRSAKVSMNESAYNERLVSLLGYDFPNWKFSLSKFLEVLQ